ncbi:MAG: hypothetical protein ACHP9Y_03600 [Gammaproteobacteria bacterium]
MYFLNNRSHFQNPLSPKWASSSATEQAAIGKAFSLIVGHLPPPVTEPETELLEILDSFHDYRAILAVFNKYDLLNTSLSLVFAGLHTRVKISTYIWLTELVASKSEVANAPAELSKLKTWGFLTPKSASAIATVLEAKLRQSRENSHSNTAYAPIFYVSFPLEQIAVFFPEQQQDYATCGQYAPFFSELYDLGLLSFKKDYLPLMANIEKLPQLSYALFRLKTNNPRENWKIILDNISALSTEDSVDEVIDKIEGPAVLNLIQHEMQKDSGKDHQNELTILELAPMPSNNTPNQSIS